MREDRPEPNMGVTRRDALKLLGGATTVLAAVHMPTGDVLEHGAISHTGTDVVVVGAGFAGMMAARRLIRAGKKVVVLEARNRWADGSSRRRWQAARSTAAECG